MKKVMFISLGILMSFIFSCTPSVEEAMKYNNKITTEQTKISEKIEILNDSYDNYIAEEMKLAHKSALDQTLKGINEIQKLEAFDSDTMFKNSALHLFNVYKEVLENEHKRIIELLILPDDRYGKPEIKEFEILRNQSIDKVDKEVNKLIKVQEEFSKKYNFVIEDEY
ncbi:MAG: hypothetical protein JXR51_02715 [Bacteroidales bacterium]|nr:hypothetical protein [Bacteroidales bacterium]